MHTAPLTQARDLRLSLIVQTSFMPSPCKHNRGRSHSRASKVLALLALSVRAIPLILLPGAMQGQASATRTVPAASRLQPIRVRVDGLPVDAGLVRVSVQVEATSEQIVKSVPAGYVSRILVPAGLVTVSGDTILVKRDSLGPTFYAPVATGQTVVPDTGIAVVRYAPLTGVVEVRTEGGPPGLRALLMLYHQCEGERASCETFVGASSIPGASGGNVEVGLAGSEVRVATARLGVWRAFVQMGYLPVDADGASVWCPSPTSTSASVRAGQVSSMTIRFVKRKACS